MLHVDKINTATRDIWCNWFDVKVHFDCRPPIFNKTTEMKPIFLSLSLLPRLEVSFTQVARCNMS